MTDPQRGSQGTTPRMLIVDETGAKAISTNKQLLLFPDAQFHRREPSAKATRKRFKAAEKARILDAYEKASAVERTVILRREGIDSSLISAWHKRRNLKSQPPSRSGPEASRNDSQIMLSKRQNVTLEVTPGKADNLVELKDAGGFSGCPGEIKDQLELFLGYA